MSHDSLIFYKYDLFNLIEKFYKKQKLKKKEMGPSSENLTIDS
jgi:hypothetical protein